MAVTAQIFAAKALPLATSTIGYTALTKVTRLAASPAVKASIPCSAPAMA